MINAQDGDGKMIGSHLVAYKAQCVACGREQTALIGHGADHDAARVGLPCTGCASRLVVALELRRAEA